MAQQALFTSACYRELKKGISTVVARGGWVLVRQRNSDVEFHAAVTVNAEDCHEQDGTTGDGQHNYCVCFSNA